MSERVELGRFMYAQYLGASESGRTGRWAIRNTRSAEPLGRVGWYGPWRQYVFYPEPDCVFSSDCMEEIVRFVKGCAGLTRAGAVLGGER